MKRGLCQKLDRFADGELPVGEMELFQEHLLICARCLRELETIFALKGLAETGGLETTAPVTRRVRVPTRRFWRFWLLGVGGALAVVTAIVLVARPWAPAPELAWELGPTRTLEARLEDPRADRHRRYDQLRGGEAKAKRVDYSRAAALEARGDVKGLVSLLLLEQRLSEARALLTEHPDRRELDNERAVVAWLDKQPEEGLRYLERILAANPQSLPAQWNRALILRDMGLGYAAAKAFGAIAAGQEPGWSDEARVWSQKLTALTDARKRRWLDAEAESQRLAEALTLPSAGLVSEFPDLVRADFYLALRRSSSAQELAALEPLAHALDRHYGGDVLFQHVRRIARGPLAKRAALLATYADLRAKRWTEPKPGSLAEFHGKLRAAGPVAADLRFGFLLETAARLDAEKELAKLGQELGDPWLQILVVEAQAGAKPAIKKATKDGRLDAPERERVLLAATELATQYKLPLRRLKLQVARAYLLLNQHRLREAEPVIREVRAAAQALGFWKIEITALIQLAHLVSFRQSIAALEAYREEIILDGASCTARLIVQGRLAERALYDGDRTRAQRALDDTAGCAGDPATEITGLAALSELAHADPQGPAAARFRRALATARPRLSPADALMASALEGRAVMATDRAEGQRILTSVITNADGMQPGDLDAIKPRLLAYRRLISAAAERSDFARALELMAAESQTPLPLGCVLGLSEDLNRAVVVARGPEGELVGRAGINLRSAGPGSTPVAAAELAALKGCGDVAVIGLSPFHGRARLLPPEIAWRHHTRGPGVDGQGDERLVISDVAPPPGLPMLPPWQPGAGLGRFRHLRGPEANPGRVLAALPGADLVEFHVHGLVDASDASYLALAPDERGDSTLTAAQVRAVRLPRRPLVVLAACDSAANSREFPSYSGRWSLPAAFINAGARAVLAATTAMPDAGAQEFMGDVVARIERGVPAAHALRDVRMAWLGRGQTWVNDVVLFE